MAYHKRRTMKRSMKGKKNKRKSMRKNKRRVKRKRTSRRRRKQTGGVLDALKTLILPGAFTMAVMSRKGRKKSKGRKNIRTMKRGKWLNRFDRKRHSFKLNKKSRRRRRR